MPGVLQHLEAVVKEIAEDDRELTEGELIAIALQMCPAGESIEIHEAHCDVFPCARIPRVIQKPMAS